MGGSASRSCTNFRHIVTTNARVASFELGGPPPTVSLPGLHQAVDGAARLDCRDDGEGCSTIEQKEEQAVFGDIQEEGVATGTEITDIVEEEEVKEGNLRKEYAPIYLNNSLKATESPHSQPRFTAFEIPVHIGPCAMLTPMKPRNSPYDTTKVESHRLVEKASTGAYFHPRTHSVALSRRYTPCRGPMRKKSISPQRKTLCQKYPSIYRKTRENVLPLITNSTPSTQTNGAASSFRSESSCSLLRLNVSSEWRTNRLGGDTRIHYPDRVSASQATRRSKLPQNPSARRLKPIDKSMIPKNPAAGDQTPSPSEPQKPALMLPPLTRSEVSRVRPTCKRGGDRREVGLGAPCDRNGGSSLPPLTSFSSPHVENADPFSSFALQMDEDGNSEKLMQRDRLIFRNSRSVGQTSYFKQYPMDGMHDSTKH